MRTSAFLFVCLAALPAFGAQIDDITDLPDGQVFVLGEYHDSAIQHLNQAQAIRAISPAAVVFEQLTPDVAAKLTSEDRASPEQLAKATGWADSGWPAMDIYWPVFEAVGQAAIYGAWVQREDLRASVGQGAAAVFGPEAARFGLDQSLPAGQQEIREAEQMEAHCNAMPAEMMGGMVESQRLRDAALAKATLTALQDTGGPVVVITGNGHARVDWGMPYLLGLAAPDVRVVSVGQLEQVPDDPPPYDLWLVTAPTERDDPCAAFGTQE